MIKPILNRSNQILGIGLAQRLFDLRHSIYEAGANKIVKHQIFPP